jgi:quinol monooxygenase YgiN
MIIATGRISTEPEDIDELLADLNAGVERSREEDGCLFYSFGLESAAAGSLLTLQIWRDEEALAAHLCTPEIASFVKKWTGRYEVSTKLYDADNERPVGSWNNPDLERQIQESRS